MNNIQAAHHTSHTQHAKDHTPPHVHSPPHSASYCAATQTLSHSLHPQIIPQWTTTKKRMLSKCQQCQHLVNIWIVLKYIKILSSDTMLCAYRTLQLVSAAVSFLVFHIFTARMARRKTQRVRNTLATVQLKQQISLISNSPTSQPKPLKNTGMLAVTCNSCALAPMSAGWLQTWVYHMSDCVETMAHMA